MIDRRIFGATLGAFVISPAFGQTQGQPTTTDLQRGSGKTTTNDLQAGQTSSASADQTHHKSTLAAGSLSLLASRLAVSRARSAPVKQFAEFEVAEQEAVADVLLTLDGKLPVDGKIRIPSDADAERNLSDADRDALNNLRSAQTGATFDQAYLKMQMSGHEQLLQTQNNYLAVGTDPGRVNVAKLAKSQIRDHIQLLANLERDNIVTGSTSPRTTGQAPAALKR
jgi:putative membrane protein